MKKLETVSATLQKRMTVESGNRVDAEVHYQENGAIDIRGGRVNTEAGQWLGNFSFQYPANTTVEEREALITAAAAFANAVLSEEADNNNEELIN